MAISTSDEARAGSSCTGISIPTRKVASGTASLAASGASLGAVCAGADGAQATSIRKAATRITISIEWRYTAAVSGFVSIFLESLVSDDVHKLITLSPG